MAEESTAEILDRCLDEVLAGRSTIDACLARYPDLRADLEPLLELATGLAGFQGQPDPVRRAAARDRFLAALESQPVEVPSTAAVAAPEPRPIRAPGSSITLVADRSVADVLDDC